jgi:drug/metabolite transporter (DMT)-like permease
MSVFAIFLLFGSALLHTTWNLLLKQAGEKYIATWWAILLGSAVFLPFLFFTGLPAHETWLLLLLSVLVEIAYYITLSTAYRDTDFSLLYPLARGTAPALIAIWSVLFLGEKLSLMGLFGLGVIILGLFIVAGGNLFQARVAPPPVKGVILALFLALLISIYSTIDGAAVKNTPAFSYAVLIFFLAPVFTTPLMFRVYGWHTLSSELSLHWLRIVSVGLLTVSAYLLALAAYSMAQVSYVGAVREVSVVMGALAGWRFLGERLGGWRVAGSVIIFVGILLVAVSG